MTRHAIFLEVEADAPPGSAPARITGAAIATFRRRLARARVEVATLATSAPFRAFKNRRCCTS